MSFSQQDDSALFVANAMDGGTEFTKSPWAGASVAVVALIIFGIVVWALAHG